VGYLVIVFLLQFFVVTLAMLLRVINCRFIIIIIIIVIVIGQFKRTTQWVPSTKMFAIAPHVTQLQSHRAAQRPLTLLQQRTKVSREFR